MYSYVLITETIKVGTDSSEAFKVWYVGFKGESRQYKGNIFNLIFIILHI